MTIGKEDRCSSPVHVHVNDDTPVHVHVKKGGGGIIKGRSKSPTTKLEIQEPGRSTRRATATSRSRSPGVWIPPPGKTTKPGSTRQLAWQAPAHRLEVHAPGAPGGGSMNLQDLSTDDEGVVTTKMRKYENKIDSLMTEMGTLKNEVELQRTFREMERKEEMLDASREALIKQEQELAEYKHELTATELENNLLRKSMDRLHEVVDANRPEMDRDVSEKEELMRKLVEAEMDGQAAAKQSAALRDVIKRVAGTRHITHADSNIISKQKEILMDRLAHFEATNHCLRRLLRSQQREEAHSLRLGQQREVLIKKLSEGDNVIENLRLELLERERRLTEKQLELEAQMDTNKNLSGVQTAMDATRAHLQKHLRQKEADCNRMAVQIRSLESQLAQEKIDNDHLQELLASAKDKAEKDKEALKKATRVQKQRASRSEDAVEQLNSQLLERETQIGEMRTVGETLQSRLDKLIKEKSQALSENGALRSRIADVETALAECELRSSQHIDQIQSRLQEKSAVANEYKLENERLKSNFTSIEDKLAQAETEVSTLRSSLRQYENLVDEYRGQDRANRTFLTKVRTQLQHRLSDLEPVPELLRSTELRLQDVNEKNAQFDRRHTENTRVISEYALKVDALTGKLDTVSEKNQLAEDHNRELENRLERLERKLRDTEAENNDLVHSVNKREDLVHQHNALIEEKGRENAVLQRQLEQALTEARRQAEQSRDKSSTKERASHGRILDMESQLSQLRSEMAKMRREKEEAERRYNSRLYDLKDRLEQSHSTNRSMQNYVQFLKQSYANVFGEPSCSPADTSIPYRSRLQ